MAGGNAGGGQVAREKGPGNPRAVNEPPMGNHSEKERGDQLANIRSQPTQTTRHCPRSTGPGRMFFDLNGFRKPPFVCIPLRNKRSK